MKNRNLEEYNAVWKRLLPLFPHGQRLRHYRKRRAVAGLVHCGKRAPRRFSEMVLAKRKWSLLASNPAMTKIWLANHLLVRLENFWTKLSWRPESIAMRFT